jgi:hypothetical protein
VDCWAEVGTAEPARHRNSVLVLRGQMSEASEKFTKEVKGSSALICAAIIICVTEGCIKRVFDQSSAVNQETLDRCFIAGAGFYRSLFAADAKKHEHVSWERLEEITNSNHLWLALAVSSS